MSIFMRSAGRSSLWGVGSLLLLALTIVSCGGGGGSSSDSGGPAASAEFTLSSDEILFGNLVANKQSERSVMIQNTGTADLVIGQIDQANQLAPRFSIPDNVCSGVTLAPSAACTVVVLFAPATQGPFTDAFSIPSNAGDRLVNVSGKGQGLNVTINSVDTSALDTITLLVTVTDFRDAPITGLDDSKFTLTEGTAGKIIGTFSNTVASPVSAVLVLDYSGSLIDFKDEIQDAAKSFVNALQPTGEVAVIKFGGTVDLATGFKSISILAEKQEILDAIDSSYLPEGGTKFYDAVYDGLELLELRNPANRRTVIVLSDGLDYRPPDGGQYSDAGLDDVIDFGRQISAFIYTIGFGPALPLGTVFMGRMADETGGEFLVSHTAADLNEVYLKVSQILTNQYLLSFKTTQPAGTGNSLNVSVDDGTSQGDDTVTVTY